MNIKDKLQIILITYNRCEHAKRTLDEILSDACPIHDFDITVLDNHSPDGTKEMVADLMEKHPNLKYRQNPYNLGIGGNIARAMEIASFEYLWIIADDDKYDWDNWSELESAIANDKSIICITNDIIPAQQRAYPPAQLFQATFVPSLIFNTRLFTDTTIRSTLDNAFTLFPHLVPIVSHLNCGGKITVLEHSIVHAAEYSSDMSYTRGTKREMLFNRTRLMTFTVGYMNIINNIKDRRLQLSCYHYYINGKHNLRQGYFQFHVNTFQYLAGNENRMNFSDVYMSAPWWMRFTLLIVHILQNTFLCNMLRGSLIAKIVNRSLWKKKSK